MGRPDPVVIGALGGSGTRVVARLVQRAGVFMGTHRNESEDAMEFVAFYDRWINRFVCRHDQPLRMAEIADMNEECRQSVARHVSMMPAGETRWGWKEPRSLYLLPFFHARYPEMRFIHVVRDGRDMAFSPNQNQLRKHGAAILDAGTAVLPGPVRTAGLWTRINLATADYGEGSLEARYLRIRFEDLCREPTAVARTIFAFLGIDPASADQAVADVQCPPTIGRWRATPDPVLLAAIQRQAQPALRRFGYVF